MIKSITIKNFGCFRGSTQINLEEFKDPVIFIEGKLIGERTADSNGAGKTTIVNAIAWCLYGQTPKKLRFRDSIISRGHESCEVAVEFKNDSLKIVRSRDAGKPDKVSVYCGSELIGEGNEFIVKEVLEEDYELFSNINYIGRDSKSSQFIHCTPKERLDLLDDLTYGPLFQKCNSICSGNINRIKAEIASLEASGNVYQSQNKDNIEKLTEYKRQLRECQRHSQTMQHEKSLVVLEKELASYNDQRKLATSQIADLREQLLLTDHEFTRAHHEYLSWRHVENLEDTCSLCHHKITPEFKKQQLEVLKAKTATYSNLSKERSVLENKLNSLRHTVDDELRFAIDKVEKRIDEIKTQMEIEQQVSNTKTDMLYSLIEEFDNKVYNTDQMIKELAEEKQGLIKEKELYTFWQVGFSFKGLPSLIISKFLVTLTENTRQFLQLLLPGTNLKYTVEKGGIVLELYRRDKQYELNTLSTGEMWRVSIAAQIGILLTLQSYTGGAILPLLILDDIYGDLDDSGITHVTEALMNELTKHMEQIFITLPRTIPAENAGKITVVREGKSVRIT